MSLVFLKKYFPRGYCVVYTLYTFIFHNKAKLFYILNSQYMVNIPLGGRLKL